MRKARFHQFAVATAVVLVAAWAILSNAQSARAGKPDKSPGLDNHKFTVDLVQGDLNHDPEVDPPLWAPDVSAQTVGSGGAKYHFLFPNPALLTTSMGATLTDDVGCSVYLDKKGRVSGLMVRGQDVAGENGIMHVSEEIVFESPVAPPPAGEVFTLHVDLKGVEIWKTNSHTLGKRTALVEMVGTISIGDIIFTPIP